MSASRTRLHSEQVGQNILSAAVEVFAARGWAGFTLEAVARESGVGKASIYRRYRSREELMGVIIDSHMFDGPVAESGDLAADLRSLVQSYAEWLDGPGGKVSLRFFLEDRLNDEFRAMWLTSARPQQATQALYGLIDRAKSRGAIDADVRTDVVLHLLLGSVVQQLAASRAPSGEVFGTPDGQEFLDQVVGRVIEMAAV